MSGGFFPATAAGILRFLRSSFICTANSKCSPGRVCPAVVSEHLSAFVLALQQHSIIFLFSICFCGYFWTYILHSCLKFVCASVRAFVFSLTLVSVCPPPIKAPSYKPLLLSIQLHICPRVCTCVRPLILCQFVHLSICTFWAYSAQLVKFVCASVRASM